MSFENSSSDSSGGGVNSLVPHHTHVDLHQSLQISPRHYESRQSAKLTSLPTASAFVGERSERARNVHVAASNNITPTLPTRPPNSTLYDSTDFLLGSGSNEKGPILLDVPNGKNELVMAAVLTQEVPKLYPIVGLRTEMPGIALPPPIPLDLPVLGGKKKIKNVKVDRHQQQTVATRNWPSAAANHNTAITLSKQQTSSYENNIPLELSDPQNIVERAAQFYHAGDYGTMVKILEVLDRHLVLSEEIEMAREFGQGLSHYSKYQYRIAKTFFESLLELSVKYQSAGNHSLASIYLGEVELYWGNNEEAVKHFTVAADKYHTDSVAELFQMTVLSKSTVLVRKGSCHRALSQIKEAISAFKTAKEQAELQQCNRTGETLKAAKEDELDAVSALGNILQSIGDYEQSHKCYCDSLKLSKVLGDRVSEAWAHGNLGNSLLGLDQKDKALDHLTIAYNMSAKYECHPLAVGRAVSNLGNAYQAMGSLEKAKEHYKIALGHAIYGSDQQGQGRACGNIGNIYMTMKEPVKAVHYYTETLRLSIDRSTKITAYHNRGCARFEVAEYIIQEKKPKELVPSNTQDSVYRTLTIKLTDEMITTHPVQETQYDIEPSGQGVSESAEPLTSTPQPVTLNHESLDIMTREEVTRLTEALPFYETAKADLIEAVDAHEQSVQNVKGSHESLNLSLLLFEGNSRSFYKLQETLVELGRVYQRLSELGVMDLVSAEPQEFKQALVYAEQARARTLGELILQKKKASNHDLFAITTPLVLQDIYRAVEKQKMPVVFLTHCLSKLLMWVLLPIGDEVRMRCSTIQLKDEDFDNSSFELYIRYNLLQFLNQNEVHIFQRCAYEQESPFTVLYDVIAKKIMGAFESLGASKVTEFIVIPDSVTHLMPFSSLINKQNWEFFGDRFRIRIIPSFLSQLVMSVSGDPVVEIPGNRSDFLVVGNPTIPAFEYDSVQWNLGRLPYAEKEAVSVADIIGTTAVLREQATKQSVLYRLRSAKIIHLATHGSAIAGFLAFASSFPVPKSGIADTEHILIFPKEVETLNISPALVVLSSCDSGRGQVKAEGVIGMARAFLSAGAQSVLVSLWRVPDESAHIFMQYFYQFLVNGLPSFHALQRSMQSLRCFHKYSHFVHWSGFQIIGKEITLHKSSNSQFPILKMIGEASIFPRQIVKDIAENLLGLSTKSHSDIQLLVGTPGNEPEECARDFIKTYYQYYPCGVYWYDVSDELILETCVKVVTEAILMIIKFYCDTSFDFIKACISLKLKYFRAILKSLSLGAYKAGTHRNWIASLANGKYVFSFQNFKWILLL
ncbi:tetratricopeptide repeat protein 28-like isoform X2 [Dysidea avara]|uniref:tetratricopeptide repeat protein 28-like isoform X2 n=1 Tax=Dysidea avara TaxID=196820 RepID=UPI0033175453